MLFKLIINKMPNMKYRWPAEWPGLKQLLLLVLWSTQGLIAEVNGSELAGFEFEKRNLQDLEPE